MDEETQLTLAILRRIHTKLGDHEALEKVEERIDALKARNLWLFEATDLPKKCFNPSRTDPRGESANY